MSANQEFSLIDEMKSLFRMENLEGLMALVRNPAIAPGSRGDAAAFVVELANHPAAAAAVQELETIARDSTDNFLKDCLLEDAAAMRRLIGRATDVDYLLKIGAEAQPTSFLANVVMTLLGRIPGATKRVDVQQWLSSRDIGEADHNAATFARLGFLRPGDIAHLVNRHRNN